MSCINTLEALGLVQEAGVLIPRLPKSERAELQARLETVLSIVVFHLRVAIPEVSEEQREHVAALRRAVARLREKAA